MCCHDCFGAPDPQINKSEGPKHTKGDLLYLLPSYLSPYYPKVIWQKSIDLLFSLRAYKPQFEIPKSEIQLANNIN